MAEPANPRAWWDEVVPLQPDPLMPFPARSGRCSARMPPDELARCMCSVSPIPHYCTRPEGHPGRHVTTDSFGVCCSPGWLDGPVPFPGMEGL